MAKRPAKTLLLIEDEPDEACLIRKMLNDPISGVFELARGDFGRATLGPGTHRRRSGRVVAQPEVAQQEVISLTTPRGE